MSWATRPSFGQSPMIVFYEMTRACDLACVHCRACAQPRVDPAELSKNDVFLLVDQLTEFPEPPLLVLTGGDPLKRVDLFQIIRYAASRGLEVSITPSATPLVTTRAIDELKDSGISRMAISIDGTDAETHDSTRGIPGSFDRSLQILEYAHSIGLETQINTVLTPKNVDQIESMACRFAGLGIRLWSVFFLVPVGRGDQLPRLDSLQCEAAFARLFDQSLLQPFLVKTTEAPHYRRYLLQHRSLKPKAATEEQVPRYVPAGLNDGKGILFISHIGEIYPSGFLPIHCGRFPTDHVVQVYQDSPVFQSLRDSRKLQGKCGRCEFRKLCGGSRARAYSVTGDLFAEEPDCVYEPA